MPNLGRAVRSPIYGSGTGNQDEDPPSNGFKEVHDMMNAAMVFPLQLVNSILSPLAKPLPGANGYENRRFRQHTPHGEVVQTMSSKELTRRNIFGSGGSQ